MFFKKPLQQLPLQYLLLFLLLGLSLWQILSKSGVTLLDGVCFLLLIGSAVALLLTMWNFQISERRKYYPAMLLPLLLQCFLTTAAWQAYATLFLLCACYYPLLFSVYTKSYRLNFGILSGMLCGLLGYLHAPMLLLLLFFYATLVNQRLVSLRSLLQPLVGLLVFVLYVCACCFLFSIPFQTVTDRLLGQVKAISFVPLGQSWTVLTAAGAMLLLYMVSTYRMIRTLYTKNILLRKKCVLLFFLSLFFLLLTLFSPAENLIPLFALGSTVVMIVCEEEVFSKRHLFENAVLAVFWLTALLTCIWK